MSEGTAFKHISVVAEPEEDMVIEAGMTEPVAPVTAKSDSEIAHSVAPEQKLADVAPVQKSVEESSALEGKTAGSSQATEAKAAGGKRAKKTATDDDYRDPTLDDLKGAPMPMAQKVVIVAAVVLIVMAIVYCTLFMG